MKSVLKTFFRLSVKKSVRVFFFVPVKDLCEEWEYFSFLFFFKKGHCLHNFVREYVIVLGVVCILIGRTEEKFDEIQNRTPTKRIPISSFLVP